MFSDVAPREGATMGGVFDWQNCGDGAMSLRCCWVVVYFPPCRRYSAIMSVAFYSLVQIISAKAFLSRGNP